MIVALKKRIIGSPRLICAADSLGFILAWTGTQGSTIELELIFGMTQIPVSAICILAWLTSSESYNRCMVQRYCSQALKKLLSIMRL